MNVAQILKLKGSTKVETVTGNETLADAARMLSEKRIGALIVGDGKGGVGGIISERDIIRTLGVEGIGCMTSPVSSAMTSKVQHCEPTEATETVLARMTEGRFRHMPVLHDGKLVGVISIGDAVKARISEIEHENEALADMIKGY
jgi:CBS domain-containing protein